MAGRDETAPGETGRELAVIPQRTPLAAARSLPGFLTQLIACARRVPAYRQARIADPVTAKVAYLARQAIPSGRVDVSV